jgi:hypothetical protein
MELEYLTKAVALQWRRNLLQDSLLIEKCRASGYTLRPTVSASKRASYWKKKEGHGPFDVAL